MPAYILESRKAAKRFFSWISQTLLSCFKDKSSRFHVQPTEKVKIPIQSLIEFLMFCSLSSKRLINRQNLRRSLKYVLSSYLCSSVNPKKK